MIFIHISDNLVNDAPFPSLNPFKTSNIKNIEHWTMDARHHNISSDTPHPVDGAQIFCFFPSPIFILNSWSKNDISSSSVQTLYQLRKRANNRQMREPVHIHLSVLLRLSVSDRAMRFDSKAPLLWCENLIATLKSLFSFLCTSDFADKESCVTPSDKITDNASTGQIIVSLTSAFIWMNKISCGQCYRFVLSEFSDVGKETLLAWVGVGDVCFFLTMRCFNDAMFSNS